MGFNEITASSLVKIDLDGNVVAPGTHGGAVNKAGFVIHSAVHAGRADAKCIMHTHERNITAVSCMAEGLLPLTQACLTCTTNQAEDQRHVLDCKSDSSAPCTSCSP